MLRDSTLRDQAAHHGTSLYLYDMKLLRTRAEQLRDLRLPYGFLPRYAVKANMHPEIIALFRELGLSFDASSSYEASELIEMGVKPERISLSSQQPAHNLDKLLEQGVLYTATSLHQLELFLATATRGSTVGLRVNPGVGAGGNNRLTTGGHNASFGLWHEYLDQALEAATQAGVTIDRLHIHYGSGAKPEAWGHVIDTGLQIAARMPDVTSLDIGGGLKVKRYEGEVEADPEAIASVFSAKLEQFAETTSRKLRLELEPGTWLVAHAGTLVSSVVDIVDTGSAGHRFLRLDTGMNDLVRPTLYGAQHEIRVINDSTERESYVVVGHNCETGDLLTPAPGDPEEVAERTLNRATIGDFVAIYDTGAYGAYFAMHGYNSFPSAKQVCVEEQ